MTRERSAVAKLHDEFVGVTIKYVKRALLELEGLSEQDRINIASIDIGVLSTMVTDKMTCEKIKERIGYVEED